MRSPNTTYLPAIDHLRALAALIVLIYHGMLFVFWYLTHGEFFDYHRDAWFKAATPLDAVVIEGHSGVALFMVVSGFIFTFGALGRSVSYPAFILNRVLRIYPLMIAMIIMGMLTTGEHDPARILRTLLIFAKMPWRHADFGPLVDGGPWTENFWTISCEFQFYLVFPLLLAILYRFGAASLALLVLLAVLVRTAVVLGGFDALNATYWTIFGRIDQFLIGMLLAVAMRTIDISRQTGWRCAAAGAAAIALILFMFNRLGGFPMEKPIRAIFPLLEALAWAAVIGGYLRSGPQTGTFAKAAAAVGNVSFSTYLLHFPIIILAVRYGWLLRTGLGALVDTGINVLILGVVIVAVSFVTFRLIERPFLEWRVRYLRPLRQAEAVPSAAPSGPSSPAL
jgi:peptidoglycan/LPS O-acetylase OafA/YrhL